MAFLPKNYEAPKSASSYMKLEEGNNKFRIVSEAVIGFEYWNENNKPVRLKENPSEKPADIRLNEDGSYTIKHFWAFVVIDRNDLSGVKILELTQPGIMRNIEDLINSEDWGNIEDYDITINRKGKGLETRYTVQPSPHKPLTKEEKEMVKNSPVNLEALFYNENPFDKNWEAPAPIPEATDNSEEVNVKDVPF